MPVSKCSLHDCDRLKAGITAAYLVLERVVKGKHLALRPNAGLAAHSQRSTLGDHKTQVQADAVVAWSTMWLDVCSSCSKTQSVWIEASNGAHDRTSKDRNLHCGLGHVGAVLSNHLVENLLGCVCDSEPRI